MGKTILICYTILGILFITWVAFPRARTPEPPKITCYTKYVEEGGGNARGWQVWLYHRGWGSDSQLGKYTNLDTKQGRDDLKTMFGCTDVLLEAP